MEVQCDEFAAVLSAIYRIPVSNKRFLRHCARERIDEEREEHNIKYQSQAHCVNGYRGAWSHTDWTIAGCLQDGD